MNARGIPTAAYQVLLEMGYSPCWGTLPPSQVWPGGGVPKVGYPLARSDWGGCTQGGVPPGQVQWGCYPRWGTPQVWRGGDLRWGTPLARSDGGYPRWGTNCPGLTGGTWGGVPPGQVRLGGGTRGGATPQPGLTGGYLRWGTPPARSDGGTRGGVPPQSGYVSPT